MNPNMLRRARCRAPKEFRCHDSVVLRRAIKHYGLKRGDGGAVVISDEGRASICVEFVEPKDRGKEYPNFILVDVKLSEIRMFWKDPRGYFNRPLAKATP